MININNENNNRGLSQGYGMPGPVIKTMITSQAPTAARKKLSAPEAGFLPGQEVGPREFCAHAWGSLPVHMTGFQIALCEGLGAL